MSLPKKRKVRRGAFNEPYTYSLTINGEVFSYTTDGKRELDAWIADVAEKTGMQITKDGNGVLTVAPKPPVVVIPLRSMGWVHFLALRGL